MPAAELPLDEAFRLAELRALSILDTPREAFFDDIVMLATRLLRTPIGLITLVDSSRQWFKAAVGLGVSETTREAAFCAHAILGIEPLIVPDAMQDARFADNPLVTGEPHIRFYAGIPLTLQSGARVGTLCAIDTKPREVIAADLDALAVLAKHVSHLLHCRYVLSVHRSTLDRERELERRLLDATREATERLAIELHDGLGQEIIGAQLLVTAVQRSLPNQSNIRSRLEEIADALSSAVKSCRELAHSQAAFVLQRDGLIEALRQFARTLEDASSVRIDFEVAQTVEACLSQSATYHVYRIAQEGLLNAIRHGKPAHVEVQGTLKSGIVEITIKDDGRGLRNPTAVGGIGLDNVRFRARMLGGRLAVKSRTPRGVVFVLAVPCDREKTPLAS